ncbi:MAG: tRNA (N(6)-L-threonylcarbamoyladenosine(37)-C(2))-methylthiotransferase MtaB [Rickettsiales bacterium]|nr:tRNA (N(6)-L-threonylcarbamoyladenosine(37)-C(2))-methylthiotransferase MtaB [Rickettsiales bacterium]
MTADDANKIVTFGCRLNAYESEAIKEALKKSDQKNLIVFNSCAVTSEAERELRSAVRRARKDNPQAKIVVTGCAAQIDPEKYARMEEVDLVLGNQEKSNPQSYSQLPEPEPSVERSRNQRKVPASLPTQEASVGFDSAQPTVNDIAHKDRIFFENRKSGATFLTPFDTSKIKVNDIMSVKDTAPQLVSYFENKTRAFLEIQNGCNHRCTFCIIPFGRGNSRSVAFGEIVDQVRKMVAAGHKEVVFTGVDISGYGEDLPAAITLSGMIKRLLKLVPELPRLRLSSIDVAEIDEEFFEILKNEPRFMPYLHLSVQSGDDIILKRMKRRHTAQQVLDFCAKARQIRPEITFGCDIIAGFPTETDEMFLNSKKLIEEAGIIFTHIFPYSKRDGTPAAKMPQVNGTIVKERAKILREAGASELQKFLKTQIGKNVSVIIEKDGVGKSENFLDVKIASECLQLQSGEIVEVKITGFEQGCLLGVCI